MFHRATGSQNIRSASDVPYAVPVRAPSIFHELRPTRWLSAVGRSFFPRITSRPGHDSGTANSLVIDADTGLNQAMSIIIGVAVMVIGGIGFWQREKISQLNRSQNKRLGKHGDLMTGVGTAKYFGIGALFMILAGAAIVIYSLVTGQIGRSNDPATALMVIVIAAVGFVVLGVVFAVMLFKRRSK